MSQTPQRGWLRAAALAALTVATLGLSACHRPAPGQPSVAPQVSGEAVLLMLTEARAWQRRADLHLSDGDLAAAIASVKEVLNIPFPSDAFEAEDVRLDACARLAKLYLATGGAAAEEQALAQLELGRKGSTHDSFFRVHLEMVAADVYEARAGRLTEPEAKKEAKRQAIGALEQATQIARRLQRALLNLPAEGTRGPVENK